MSQRQPTIEIDDRIIARDEIICLVDLNESISTKENTEASHASAIRLVDGTIVPLPPQKVNTVIDFICRD